MCVVTLTARQHETCNVTHGTHELTVPARLQHRPTAAGGLTPPAPWRRRTRETLCTYHNNVLRQLRGSRRVCAYVTHRCRSSCRRLPSACSAADLSAGVRSLPARCRSPCRPADSTCSLEEKNKENIYTHTPKDERVKGRLTQRHRLSYHADK